MSKWTEQLTQDMLPAQHQQLMSIIGIDAMMALCKSLGGTYYYIPKLDVILRNARNKLMQSEFNGGNVKELALKYELSTVQVYAIVSKADALPGQCSFF